MSATTPQRPNMASQHTPSKTPSRRVLGDLTSKAINTPSTPKAYDPAEVARAQSPLKQVTTHTPTNPTGKENLMTPQTNSNSKKRGIEEVEGVDPHIKVIEVRKKLACIFFLSLCKLLSFFFPVEAVIAPGIVEGNH